MKSTEEEITPRSTYLLSVFKARSDKTKPLYCVENDVKLVPRTGTLCYLFYWAVAAAQSTTTSGTLNGGDMIVRSRGFNRPVQKNDSSYVMF